MGEILPFFAILIVFPFIFYMTKLSNEHQKQKLKIKSGVFETENADYKQEIQELKDRIATLEKIVTDDSYALKKQFDDLDAA